MEDQRDKVYIDASLRNNNKTRTTMEQQADRRLTSVGFRNCKKYTRNSTEMLEIRMKHD